MSTSTPDIDDPSRWLTTRHLRLPDGRFPHLGTTDGEVAPTVLLSGSPERVELMAAMLDGAERVGHKRGYQVLTGTYRGVPVSVATSGVGAPSMAIAVEELVACGARQLIRVGSCASISPSVRLGGIAVAHAAVRDEGTSAYYAPVAFPAVASPRIVQALRDAAAAGGVTVTVGVTRTTDAFYEGERKAELIAQWRRLGVLAFEMETSCLFTVAAALGVESGSIVCAGSNLLTGEATYLGHALEAFAAGQRTMLEVALGAAASLGAAITP